MVCLFFTVFFRTSGWNCHYKEPIELLKNMAMCWQPIKMYYVLKSCGRNDKIYHGVLLTSSFKSDTMVYFIIYDTQDTVCSTFSLSASSQCSRAHHQRFSAPKKIRYVDTGPQASAILCHQDSVGVFWSDLTDSFLATEANAQLSSNLLQIYTVFKSCC